MSTISVEWILGKYAASDRQFYYYLYWIWYPLSLLKDLEDLDEKRIFSLCVQMCVCVCVMAHMCNSWNFNEF